MVSPYSAFRCVTWDPEHPRDSGAVAALRSASPPWEIGWRASVGLAAGQPSPSL